MPTVNGTTTILEAPKDYVINFEDPRIQYMVESYTVAAVEMTLAFLFLVQRLYTKIVLMKSFQLEDGKFLFTTDTRSCH